MSDFVFCEQCGRRIGAVARFCAGCGAAQAGGAQTTLAVVVPQLPAISSMTERIEALRRLGHFEATVAPLPVPAQTAAVRDPPPSTGDLQIDHMVAVTARNVTRKARAPAPDWTRAPTLAYYRHGDPPYNPCRECSGAGAALHEKGSELVPCPSCQATGLLLSASLERVLQARGVLGRQTARLELDRELLAQIHLDEDMGLAPEQLVKRYGSRGRDLTPQAMLERLRQARAGWEVRVRGREGELAAELTHAREEFARMDGPRQLAYADWTNPFKYLGSDLPREPSPPSPQWAILQRRTQAAGAALDRHRRWAALVQQRDAEAQRKLERAFARLR